MTKTTISGKTGTPKDFIRLRMKALVVILYWSIRCERIWVTIPYLVHPGRQRQFGFEKILVGWIRNRIYTE